MGHLLGAPIYYRLLALPENITLCWKGLPGINTLAYLPFVSYGDKELS
jgi:hypothetical protein